MKTSLRSIWQSLALGVIAGMRAVSAPAIASHLLSRNKSIHLLHSGINFMQSDSWAAGLKVMAVAELIADKMPFTPARTKPLGIAGRALSGSLCGAAISKANGSSVIAGMAIGTGAAIVSTFACYFLRREIGKRAHIDDPILGAIEDSVVLAGGLILAKTA